MAKQTAKNTSFNQGLSLAAGFRRAERKKARLRLGLAGPAGSGKTTSALLIAFGISGDWSKIGLVDTENGSGELYAGATIGGVLIGDYNVLPLSPPYLPEKYIQAIHLAEQAGLEVLVLDSISHAWAGEGGLLDLHGKISSSSKSGNSYAAWREVTPLHNQFVEAMLQSKIHIIATMRSKMEYAIEKGKDGSTTVKKLGMAPVQRDGMDYEFTTVLDLSIEHVASVSKDRTSLFDGRYFTPGLDTGQVLKFWLEAGEETAALGSVDQPGSLFVSTAGGQQEANHASTRGNGRNHNTKPADNKGSDGEYGSLTAGVYKRGPGLLLPGLPAGQPDHDRQPAQRPGPLTAWRVLPTSFGRLVTGLRWNWIKAYLKEPAADTHL